MHVQGLEQREDRIAEFKKTKDSIQKIRGEMKDLFALLFRGDWTGDSDEGKGSAKIVVHQ